MIKKEKFCILFNKLYRYIFHRIAMNNYLICNIQLSYNFFILIVFISIKILEYYYKKFKYTTFLNIYDQIIVFHHCILNFFSLISLHFSLYFSFIQYLHMNIFNSSCHLWNKKFHILYFLKNSTRKIKEI